MGAAGSTHGAFQQAVERGNVLVAVTLARELGRLSLEDALALTELFARVGDDRFQPAAVRWLARLATEREGVTLAAVQVAASALAVLPDKAALAMLRTLARAGSGAG